MEQQTTPQAEAKPDLVPLTEASDQDIEKFLENPQGGVDEEMPDGDDSAEESDSAEADEETEGSKESEAEESPKQEAAEEAESEEETTKPTEEKTSEVDSNAALHEENEVLRERVKQQEQFIQRRNSQFGEVRKEYLKIKEGLQAGLAEKAQTDPAAAIEDRLKIERIDQQLEMLDAQQTEMNQVHETQKVVLGHIKPSEVPFDAMVETLKSEVSPEWLQNFVKNPYAAKVTTADFIIQLHRRTHAETLLRKVVAAYQRLEKSSKGAAPAKPTKAEEVLRNVEKAVRAGPSVTAASGNAASKETYDLDPSQMSDAEIEEFLKRNPARKKR